MWVNLVMEKSFSFTELHLHEDCKAFFLSSTEEKLNAFLQQTYNPAHSSCPLETYSNLDTLCFPVTAHFLDSLSISCIGNKIKK